MILFVPATWHPRINWLLPFLKIPLQCFVYSSSPPGCREIFPGNGQVSSLGEPCIIFPGSPPPGPLREMQQRFPGLDLLFRRDRWELSHLGLPVLWKKGSGTYWFDFFNPRRVRSIPGDCAEHVAKVIRLRSGKGKGRDSLYYRFAPERWMESLLIRDLSLVRPNLGSRFYCQVPSRQGRRRKILDILAADLRGRLVVLEIKVECRIEDLFQGLGYRERVARHLVNGDFQRLGYFQGMELEQEVPALGFVSPLFAFHRGMPGIWRYLKPGGEVFCTGLNSDWRNGIRPLRRFGLEPGGGYGRETPRS